MSHSSRTSLLGGFAAVAAGLMLASAAFACVPYKGKMTVTGTDAGGTSLTVVGNGTGMGYCEPPGESANVPGGALAVRVFPKENGACASRLADGQYVVSYRSGLDHPDTATEACLVGGGLSRPGEEAAEGIPIGTLLVQNGTGSGSFRLPSDAKLGYGAVCVTDPTYFNAGHRAPIWVT